jgi:hypothetical protein
VLAAATSKIEFLAKKEWASTENVFRKLEVTKFEMELSRAMVTRVVNWKEWKKEVEVILPISDPYRSWGWGKFK